MTRSYVLDSFAIIAFIRHQPGYLRVRALLEQAQLTQCQLYISEINVGEVLYIIERAKGISNAQRFLSTLMESPVHLISASFERIQAAAHLKAHHPIAYADAFAAALAQEFKATLITGDPEFQSIQHLIRVEWLESG